MHELVRPDDAAGRAPAAARRALARATPSARAGPALLAWRPPALWCALIALAETAPLSFYCRPLVARQPVLAVLGLLAAGIGTAAGYLALVAVSANRRWLAWLTLPAAASASALAQLVHFGVHRELGALPSVSSVDFLRQNSRYALALFVDRLDARAALLGVGLIGVLVVSLFRASAQTRHASSTAVLGLFALGLTLATLVPPPFRSTSQRAAQLLIESLSGPGAINASWDPDRLRPASTPARHPINILLFRLEEIAADATSLARPGLPTTPYLKSLADDHPEDTFVGLHHFANATATDVSVVTIFSGLAPAAPLQAQRRVPLLWDYFQAAGYETSLFLPDHLEWGDFRHRFEARPGELHLDAVVDAGNAHAPLVYDHSLNDSAISAEALAYQEQRHWAEPFLQVVSLRMPHALGEGARINRLGRGPWPGEPSELWSYYDAIRHDDALMADFVAHMPDPVRRRTALVFVSDHGTSLFARREGDTELHRLDNYHPEATRVPLLVHLPREGRQGLDSDRLQRLRDNLSTHATSNIDLVPTLLGLVGIRRVELPLAGAASLAGRDLGAALATDSAIVQCNTGPLRRWDRERFALLMSDGAQHYFFGAGGEQLFDLQRDPLERIDVAAEPAFREPLERARTLAAGLPELARIQQQAAGSRLPPARGLERTELLSPGLPDRLVLQHALTALDSRAAIATVVEARFAVRILRGTGHLEWRVRGAPDLSYVAHVEGLEPGDLQRFEFRWRPPQGSVLPLDVQLFAGADAGETFELERVLAQAQPATEQVASTEREAFQLLAFEAESEKAAGAEGVSGLAGAVATPFERFTRHACLAAVPAEPCPNGFMVWGPYVPARRGARLSLRYQVSVAHPSAKLWVDIASNQASTIVARSRSIELAEPGSLLLLLRARLAGDASDLEGRLNAHGGARVEPGALLVRDAQLRVEAPRW